MAAQLQSSFAVGEAAGIAQVMGLRRWQQMSDMTLVRKVEDGLPLDTAERVSRLIVSDLHEAKFALVSPSTHARVKKRPGKNLSRDLSEKVYSVARVVYQALRLWKGDTEAVRRFMARPHQLLDGRTPSDVATESSAGADLVVRLLGRARAGVAV